MTVGKGAASLLATLGTIFALIVLFLLEGPKMRQGLLKLMPPERAAYYTRVAREISQSATGYALGNLLTSLIAGVVVFVTLTVLGVPFPLLWALWVALVDFLPMVGGALAGIPTVLFALGHSLTAGIVTAAAFIAYQQIENHVLNPVVMSRTVNVNPLLVLLSLLVGTSIGDWVGGFFGSFVAALLSIPVAGALQVITRELWQATAWPGPPDSVAPAEPGLAIRDEHAAETDRRLRDGEQEPDPVKLKAPTFDLSGALHLALAMVPSAYAIQVRPSISSRAASRWPAWHAVSVITWRMTSRRSRSLQLGHSSVGHLAGGASSGVAVMTASASSISRR